MDRRNTHLLQRLNRIGLTFTVECELYRNARRFRGLQATAAQVAGTPIIFTERIEKN
jgi:hypothetical protein